ncbi:MAG: beta-propeller fold lactonase family protein [Thermoplasmata archaeon]|nr:beta-propeller fold lactonase family protein [Thermoplasmata archaeon]
MILPSGVVLGTGHHSDGEALLLGVPAATTRFSPAGGLPPLTGNHLSATTPPEATPSGGVFQPGSVSETYDLRNQSLLAGNARLPENGAGPDAVAADTATARIFVADAYSYEVTILNAANGSVLGTIPTPGTPTAITLDYVHNEAIVVCPTDNFAAYGSLAFLNASTGALVRVVNLSSNPSAVALDPANQVLYVAQAGADSIAVLNWSTDAVVGSIPVGSYPRALALDITNHTLYVADNVTDGNLTLVNTTNGSVESTLNVGANPHALLLLGGTPYLYVADYDANRLAVVDTVSNVVAYTIPLGAGPYALAENTAKGYVYTDNTSTNTLDVINSGTQSVLTTIGVGNGPQGLAWDSATSQVYVAEVNSDNVTFVSAATQVPDGSVLLGLAPAAMAYDPVSNELAVAVSDQDALWLLNATTEQRVQTVAVGSDPDAVTYDSVNECFYVANFVSDSVTVVNGSTNLRIITLPVGLGPVGIALAAAYDYLFVENSEPTAASLHTTYDLTEISGSTNTIVGTLTVGQQGFLYGIAYDATNGDLYIGAGNNVTVLNPLSKLVVATLNLTALGDSIIVVPSTGDVLVAGEVTTTFNTSDNLSVIDPTTQAVTETIYVGGGTVALDYDAANGAVYASNFDNDTVGVVNLAAGIEVANLSTGWYPGAIADDGTNGQIFVASYSNASISIVTLPGLGAYPINFTEQGLPTGHVWSVTLAGVVSTSSAPSMLLVGAVGIVQFNVGAIPGYAISPSSGNLSVTDVIQAQTIVFVRLPTTYPVQFSESNLPSGTNWTVDFNGTSLASVFPTITFQVTNGTATFTVPAIAGYRASPTGGSVTVTGAPLAVNITFAPVATTTSSSSSAPNFGVIEGFGTAAVAAIVGGLAGAVIGRRGGGKPFPDPPSPNLPG